MVTPIHNVDKIFWDLDETLIHTELSKASAEYKKFTLIDGNYYAVLRPNALEAVNYTRSKYGEENVYMLTVATFEYAISLNRDTMFDLGFAHNQIFAREDLDFTSVLSFANKHNVLIDNLPHYSNYKKTKFIGITEAIDTQYVNVPNYYGDKEDSYNLFKHIKSIL